MMADAAPGGGLEPGVMIWNAACLIQLEGDLDIMAIDPGLRNCGVARVVCDPMGVRLIYGLEEPIVYTFSDSLSINAGKLSETLSATTGGNFARYLTLHSHPKRILIEVQPPYAVTGAIGRNTRCFTYGLLGGFLANGIQVEMRSVRHYKADCFGFEVHSRREDNKHISLEVIRVLSAMFPLAMGPNQFLATSNSDVADALILLFSAFVERVATLSLCQSLFPDLPLTNLQLLHLSMILMEVSLNPSLIDDPQWSLNHCKAIRGHELYQNLLQRSLVLSVETTESKSKSTKRRKTTTSAGASSASGLLVNPSTMNRRSMISSSPRE